LRTGPGRLFQADGQAMAKARRPNTSASQYHHAVDFASGTESLLTGQWDAVNSEVLRYRTHQTWVNHDHQPDLGRQTGGQELLRALLQPTTDNAEIVRPANSPERQR